MLIPKCVECAVQIYDILQRSDCEYVPSRVFVEHTGWETKMMQTILYRMRKNDLLTARKGPQGGYAHKRPVSLLELFRVLTPSRYPLVRISCSYDVNRAQKRVIAVLDAVVFDPKDKYISSFYKEIENGTNSEQDSAEQGGRQGVQ
jgi:DNA-binding IscR family transcriptional regulator